MNRSEIRDVCTRCACWVEKSWSFCKHCGAPRPAKHPPPAVSPSSLYISNCRNIRVTTVPRKSGGGKRPLGRRRPSSEDVDTHIQQWRAKSKIQEDLLHHLESCNVAARQGVVSNVESDLRQIVRDGREFVRTWPMVSDTRGASTLTLSSTDRKRGRREVQRIPTSTTAKCTVPTVIVCSPNGRHEVTKELESSSRYQRDTSAVYAATTGDFDELYNPACPPSSRSQFPIVSTITIQGRTVSSTSGVPLQVGDILRRPKEGTQGKHKIKSKRLAGGAGEAGEAGEAVAQPSGWFWGDGGCCPGRVNVGRKNSSDTNGGVPAPGKGAMGAFWRETRARGKYAHKFGGNVAPRDAAAPAAGEDHHLSSSWASSADRRAMSGTPPAGGDFLPTGKSEISIDVSSKAFINVASTKATVQSASNRMAELLHLINEGNNPPREECLAKAEAAVRAAQSAISCAIERLFQLELTAVPNATSTRTVERSENAAACESSPDERDNYVDVDAAVGISANSRNDCAKRDTCSANSSSYSSSLFIYIEQLSEQLELAQNLQATSLTARARLTKRFALEDAAAARLQALARGIYVRRREQCNEARRVKTTDIGVTRAQRSGQATVVVDEENFGGFLCSSGSSLSRWTDEENISSLRRSSCRATGPQENVPCSNGEDRTRDGDERSGIASLPRKEGLWWTLAEAESPDEIGELESELLAAVVKLQASVRSRISRLKTFAAVNARFIEHFDEEHQHPFYVCSETNATQWNQPFGFALTRKQKSGVSSPALVGGEGIKHAGAALEPTSSEDYPSYVEERFLTARVHHTSKAAPAGGNVVYDVASVVKEVIADDIGESGRNFLDALVKLQALVRSRQSRSKTIAAINARFVEHFDEEYQCVFYVCSATNVSQWNRPFGFEFRRGGKHDLPSSLHCDHGGNIPSPGAIFVGEANSFEDDAHARSVASNEGEAGQELGDTKEAAAAVVIQCAVRAARARGRLAEGILLASL